MMEKSTKFISLSGLSGVAVGMIALAGCGLAFHILIKNGIDYFDGIPNYYPAAVIRSLVWIALCTLFAALWSAVFFTVKTTRKTGERLWSKSMQNMITAAFIPMLAGGLFSIIVTLHHLFFLVAPSMLIFYGLALVSASKYTRNELFSLGILQLCLGITALYFVGYGLVFWGIGFGVLHVLYGVRMHIKYK